MQYWACTNGSKFKMALIESTDCMIEEREYPTPLYPSVIAVLPQKPNTSKDSTTCKSLTLLMHIQAGQ